MERFSIASVPCEPWKNGGGVTREFCSKASHDGPLLWRVSLADITSDGPFSIFPGMARVLTIVSGEGLRLLGPDEVLHAYPGQPLRFDGSIALSSQLLDGPTQALNVMWEKGGLMAGVDIMEGGKFSSPEHLETVVYVLSGSAQINGETFHQGEGMRAIRKTVEGEISSGSKVWMAQFTVDETIRFYRAVHRP